MCGIHGAHLCDNCRKDLEALPLVHRSERSEAPNIAALGAYTGPLRAAVLSLKFRNRKSAATLLGYVLGKKLRARVDAVIPVPLHPSRLLARGFNQAHFIGIGVASALNAPLVCEALVRVKATHAQSSLGLTERTVNVGNAFAPAPDAYRLNQACVMLVDDVVTTGATITACARALRIAGVKDVYGSALAIKM